MRILIVEDDSIQRRLLARIIASFGAEIVQAGTVAEALAAPGRFDAMLLDFRLPDGTAGDIVAARPTERAITLSGYEAPRDWPHGPWLRKPYNESAIVCMVREVVAVAR